MRNLYIVIIALTAISLIGCSGETPLLPWKTDPFLTKTVILAENADLYDNERGEFLTNRIYSTKPDSSRRIGAIIRRGDDVFVFTITSSSPNSQLSFIVGSDYGDSKPSDELFTIRNHDDFSEIWFPGDLRFKVQGDFTFSGIQTTEDILVKAGSGYDTTIHVPKFEGTIYDRIRSASRK